jgi:type IX secretion system PorP/SprF family membrane protein
VLRSLFFSLFITFSLLGQSQDLPIYNHYFSNPFFYNPSYARGKNQTELNLLHRQQWTGLNDAPKISYLTLTVPVSNKIGMGLSIHNNKRGVITTTSYQAAISYKVQLNNLTSLSFGLSGGLGRNSLDISQVDPNDPAIARLLSSSLYLEGKAGVNLKHHNLNIGFSMPQIFDQSIVDANDFQKIGVNPFKTIVSSIGYKFQVSQSISFQPLVLYKLNKTTNQLEGYGTVHFREAFWLGGMYRQNYGGGALAGFQISHVLQLGYSYEFAASQNSQLNFNTHEFQLSILFGRPPEQIENDKSSKSKAKSKPKSKPKPAQRKSANKSIRRY